MSRPIRPLLYVALLVSSAVAQPAKHATAAPVLGVKTPGVRIPFASLKAEAEFHAAPQWFAFNDAVLLADDKGIYRIDPKKNELGAAVAALNKPCGGAVNAFGSIWVPTCGDQSLVRLDPKTWKSTASVASGVGSGRPALAATADSIWLLSDTKTTLSRIDPDTNLVVAELRLPAACNSITYGEASLWITCPAENRVLRIDPKNNVVDKRIEVSAEPKSVAIGEGSVWVLCQKEGKVERIDPKTNKVSKTIELGVPGQDGTIAVGQGSAWVSLPGFPVTRIDPQTDKVVQQFWGAGGGVIQVGAGALWLSNPQQGTFLRLDPKRIAATLAE